MASKKLLEAFKEFGERCESYYEISIKPDELFGDNNDDSHCREFIQEHFEKGLKKKALDFPFADEYITKGKHMHTVSLYLLGLT
ncbi:MAG: hypothetical protein LBH86_01055, partial [Oscillospiraceae bacterium]|nr:hypothetical protein [Oscillospiraceae bacterium]